MRLAPLPAGSIGRGGDGVLEPLVSVGDHQPDLRAKANDAEAGNDLTSTIWGDTRSDLLPSRGL
jgi:hypothetical protein